MSSVVLEPSKRFDRAVVEEFVPRKSSSRPPYHSYACLAVLTLACLLPFSGRAFQVDDTLFIMAAHQISHHPLDPYGFNLVWNDSLERMSDVTQNPPLACYYEAVVGEIAGWSERAFHIAFLLPALALVLGTYRLAGHFTRFPLLAALATVLTPGFLVSAGSVMCDTMMAAMWVWAMILWIEGLEPLNVWYLTGAGVLMAAAFLTKYFAVALIPLMAGYSLVRLRRLGNWLWFLLIPVAAVFGYQIWSHALYGKYLFTGAVHYANRARGLESWVSVWVGLSFTGGCALTVLTFAPLIWSRKAKGIAIAIGSLAASALIFGWLDYHGREHELEAFNTVRAHWALVGSQLAIFIAGGLLALGLAITDYGRFSWRIRRERDHLFLTLVLPVYERWTKRRLESLLLLAWVVGTFVFASFLNWTVNARSVLPLIPAMGILIARRLETMGGVWTRSLKLKIGSALVVSGVLSIWVAVGDMYMANLARSGAYSVQQQVANEGGTGTLWYRGHWGFQHYIDQAGAQPLDVNNFQIRPGDLVVVSERFGYAFHLPETLSFQNERVWEFANPSLAATMNWKLGAGFYSSSAGPLPFTFGQVPPDRYSLMKAGSVRYQIAESPPDF
ncbi:MAG: glycosyltransferase family 39 protein [Terriglobales bacterium]|jgi:4-amino-4-deoxy-L-arabinose transferase-like glycosyltransferase